MQHTWLVGSQLAPPQASRPPSREPLLLLPLPDELPLDHPLVEEPPLLDDPLAEEPLEEPLPDESLPDEPPLPLDAFPSLEPPSDPPELPPLPSGAVCPPQAATTIAAAAEIDQPMVADSSERSFVVEPLSVLV
jgi:hypothetical protein